MTVCCDQAQLICSFLNLAEDTVEIVLTFILGNCKESFLYHLFAQGTAQTSKTAQISAGITGEMSSNISFLDNQQSFVQAIGAQNLIASKAQAKAAKIQAIGGVVTSGISAYQAGKKPPVA